MDCACEATEGFDRMKPFADPARICRRLLLTLAQRERDKTICPSEVARHLGGQDEAAWAALCMDSYYASRRQQLADEGAILIKAKVAAVDTRTLAESTASPIVRDTRCPRSEGCRHQSAYGRIFGVVDGSRPARRRPTRPPPFAERTFARLHLLCAPLSIIHRILLFLPKTARLH